MTNVDPGVDVFVPVDYREVILSVGGREFGLGGVAERDGTTLHDALLRARDELTGQLEPKNLRKAARSLDMGVAEAKQYLENRLGVIVYLLEQVPEPFVWQPLFKGGPDEVQGGAVPPN